MAGSNPSENIDYHPAATSMGHAYKWMACHKSVVHNPYSYRPDARHDPFRPRYVFLPFGQHLPWWDQTVAAALGTVQVSRVPGQGVQNTTPLMGKGHYPQDRQYHAPDRYLIRADDFGEWDLTGQIGAGEPYIGPYSTVPSTSVGLNYWEAIALQQTDYEIQPFSGIHTPVGDVLMAHHPTAGLVPQTGGFLTGGTFQPNAYNGDPANAIVLSGLQFGVLELAGQRLPDHICWLGYDTVTHEWVTDVTLPEWNFEGGQDWLVVTGFPSIISVKRYGDDFYDISMAVQILPGSGDVAFGSVTRPYGSTYYKAQFPDKTSSDVPLRYVRYHRPQHPVSATTSASQTPPLFAHPGFAATVCHDDYNGRIVLDTKLDGGERILLFGDRTLVDLVSTSSTALVEARRLRLPNPTIEDSLQVTLPWNPTEVMQFDRAHDTYDFAISSKDLQTWRVRVYAKNSNTTEDVWSTLVSEAPAIFVEYGMISRRLKFNGRMPYVRQTHSNAIF